MLESNLIFKRGIRPQTTILTVEVAYVQFGGKGRLQGNIEVHNIIKILFDTTIVNSKYSQKFIKFLYHENILRW